MSWHEPYIPLACSFAWIIAGIIYFVVASKSKGKEILLTSKPAPQMT
jgi:hypothetical protein